jgi:hypothetical protein
MTHCILEIPVSARSVFKKIKILNEKKWETLENICVIIYQASVRVFARKKIHEKEIRKNVHALFIHI